SSIIPPSIAMILYGIAAEESAADLFVAGIIPGLVLALCMALYIMFRARGQVAGDVFSVRYVLQAAWRTCIGLGLPVVVLGGIYPGLCSPTEAAGVACACAIPVALFAEADMKVRSLVDSAVSAMLLTAQALIIVAASGVF